MTAHERAVTASASATAVRARLDGLEARLAEEETRGIARAARRVGGRRLDEDLAIEPGLRAAAEAALADASRAYVVEVEAVPSLAGERGSLVVAERAAARPAGDDPRERRFREALAAAGGGTLDFAVRRDTGGAARRVLARAAWLPDLAACLAIQPMLPAGWIAVPRDGSAVISDLGVTLGAAESVLERRAESERLGREAEALDGQVADLRAAAVRAAAGAQAAMAAAEAARAEESRAGGERRAAEEAERLAARRLETVVREASWHEAQAERLAAELERARATVAASETEASASVEPDETAGDACRWVRAGRLGDRAPPSCASGATAWPRMPALARPLDARRSKGVPGPRHRPRWPRSGWPAPIARSPRWASASGRWPRRGTRCGRRWPRRRPTRRRLGPGSRRSAPLTPSTASDAPRPNAMRPRRVSACVRPMPGCAARTTSISRPGSGSRRCTRAWSSSWAASEISGSPGCGSWPGRIGRSSAARRPR